MKIMVNFDLINAILDVNQDFNVMKIVRNNKRQWARFNYPLYIAIDLACSRGNLSSTLFWLFFQTNLLILPELIAGHITKHDIYKEKAEDHLKRLVPRLQDINVSASYQQLLRSELYEKRYHFEFNEKKLPELMEEKYILVPCYDPYSCDHGEREVSLLQEHVVGSKEYSLSVGSPSKQYRLSPVKGLG